MKNSDLNGKSIIGSCEVDCTILDDIDKDTAHILNSSFWDTKGGEVLGDFLFLFMVLLSQKKSISYWEIYQGKRYLK